MGRQAFRSGDNEGAVAWAERALAQAERLGADPAGSDGPGAADHAVEVASAVAQAYNTLGVALARMGRLQDAVAHIERSVAVAEAHDLMQAACRGYTNLGVLYSTLDPKRAIDTCLRGLETAKKIGDLGPPVAAEHEPGGRLLRAHEPVRGARASRPRRRPSTSTASSASSTTWRCR